MKRLNTPVLTKKFMRLVLRSIPLIPGPELFDIIEEINKSNTDINKKIDKAYSSLKETSVLINDLEKELINRTEKVEKLREEYEKYSELAQIEEKEARAIINQLEITFNKGKGRERILGIIINLFCGFIIFVIGIWLSPIITNYFFGS